MDGSYLVIKVDGSVIAEAADVSLKIIAKKLDSTSQDSGLNTACSPGKVKIGIAGKFLYASDGANWEALYEYVKAGTNLDTVMYFNDGAILNGRGILKKLNLKGANSKEKVTGTFGIRFYSDEYEYITTEDGFILITEDGKKIITE